MSQGLSTIEGLLLQTLHVEFDIHFYPFSIEFYFGSTLLIYILYGSLYVVLYDFSLKILI